MSATKSGELSSLFDEALSSGERVSVGSFSVGGRRLLVRCVGDAHWDDLGRSLLRADDGPADLTLDVWDPIETGVRPARADAELAALESHGEVLAFSPGAAELRHVGADFDMLLEPHGRATGWVSSSQVPGWHRLRPWQRIFVAALAADGAESVHASMVARAGAGVLISGPSGTGKSTTTFACLAAGLQCLGDDAIAIDLDGGAPRASTVHATVKVDVVELARYAAFEAQSDPIDDPDRDERALRLGGFPSPLVTGSARVAAIAFPRLVDTPGSRTHPLPASRAATELIRNALSVDGNRLGPVFASMTELAEAVPCFVLEVGRDSAGLAAAVEGLIDAAA
ncbi:MAG TPA: hypothetical protein VGM80_14675 [Gaiellaceae bacterium]|jgi:hypothetical protein